MNRHLRVITRVLLVVAVLGPTLGTRPASAAPARAAAAERILFMGTRNGNADLYVVERSTRSVRVVGNPGHDCGPAFAPGKGYDLVFASMRIGAGGSYDPGGHFELFKLDVATRRLTKLTHTPRAHSLGPTWSPDGKRIAFASSRNGSVGTPNWPIADGEIWMMNADGSHTRQVTAVDGFHSHSYPAWSPDGKWIAFMVTAKTEPARPSIYLVRPSGEGMHIVQYDGLYPSWSPDGRRIAFSSARAGAPNQQDLYVMDADGSNVHRITDLPGAEYMPSWSPDGQRLTYVHDPDGWTDIAAVALLPTGHTRDIYSSGPQPSSIWVGDLVPKGRALTLVHRERRTTGGNDLFPRFAPSWLH